MKKVIQALLERVNTAAGFDPLVAGHYNHVQQRTIAGYAVYAQSPGDGKTRYQLHRYDGKGSGVCDDCSWSFSSGAGEFEGKLRAFLAGLEHKARC
jgi:hypothetical protein